MEMAEVLGWLVLMAMDSVLKMIPTGIKFLKTNKTSRQYRRNIASIRIVNLWCDRVVLAVNICVSRNQLSHSFKWFHFTNGHHWLKGTGAKCLETTDLKTTRLTNRNRFGSDAHFYTDSCIIVHIYSMPWLTTQIQMIHWPRWTIQTLSFLNPLRINLIAKH